MRQQVRTVIREIYVKDVRPAVSCPNLEFLALKYKMPMLTLVLVEIAIKASFTETPLPERNTNEEAQHQCTLMLECAKKAWMPIMLIIGGVWFPG
jgi:hypothetical protein